jgi:hypothetical protein
MMLASCGVLGGPASVLAQQVAVPALTIGRAADGKRAVIDGRVDHDAWAAAEPFSAFIQQDPNEESPATELTEIRFFSTSRICTSGWSVSTPSRATFSSAKAGATRTLLTPARSVFSSTRSMMARMNRQASTISSNVRLARLDRRGTGFFVIYNDSRDTSALHGRRVARSLCCRQVHPLVRLLV